MKTGWPSHLLQDDSRKLSDWFASRVDARWTVRQVCAEIERNRMSEKQPEALGYATCLESRGFEAEAALLRTQHERITELEAWKAKIIRSSERAYGESAIRYKFSLTRTGKCMNTFPKEIDGRWFALTPAEDDGHIGHIARIDALEADRKMLRAALEQIADHRRATQEPANIALTALENTK